MPKLLQSLRLHKASVAEARSLAAKSMLLGTAGALYAGTGFIFAGFISGIYPREMTLTTREVAQKSEVRQAVAKGFAAGATIPLLIKLGLLASRRARVTSDLKLSAAIAMSSTAVVSFKK